MTQVAVAPGHLSRTCCHWSLLSPYNLSRMGTKQFQWRMVKLHSTATKIFSLSVLLWIFNLQVSSTFRIWRNSCWVLVVKETSLSNCFTTLKYTCRKTSTQNNRNYCFEIFFAQNFMKILSVPDLWTECGVCNGVFGIRLRLELHGQMKCAETKMYGWIWGDCLNETKLGDGYISWCQDAAAIRGHSVSVDGEKRWPRPCSRSRHTRSSANADIH